MGRKNSNSSGRRAGSAGGAISPARFGITSPSPNSLQIVTRDQPSLPAPANTAPIPKSRLIAGLYAPLARGESVVRQLIARAGTLLNVQPFEQFFGVIVSQREVTEVQQLISTSPTQRDADWVDERLFKHINNSAIPTEDECKIDWPRIVADPRDPYSRVGMLAYKLSSVIKGSRLIHTRERHQILGKMAEVAHGANVQLKDVQSPLLANRQPLLIVGLVDLANQHLLEEPGVGRQLTDNIGTVSLGDITVYTDFGKPEV